MTSKDLPEIPTILGPGCGKKRVTRVNVETKPHDADQQRVEQRLTQIRKICDNEEFRTLFSVPYAKAFNTPRTNLVVVVYSIEELYFLCMDPLFVLAHHILVSDFGTILKPPTKVFDEKGLRMMDTMCACCSQEEAFSEFPRGAGA